MDKSCSRLMRRADGNALGRAGDGEIEVVLPAKGVTALFPREKFHSALSSSSSRTNVTEARM